MCSIIHFSSGVSSPGFRMSTYWNRPTKMVLFVLFALLLLVNSAAAIRSLSTAASANDRLARPGSSIKRELEGEGNLAGEEPESSAASIMDAKDFDEECSDGDEECLIRRTLAAHVDYIYTQHHHNP